MSEYRIDVSKLKSEDSEKVDQLKKFLEDRIGGSVEVGDNEFIFKSKEKITINRSYLRVSLRKFLHQADLETDFRIISGGKNSFILKDKKRYGE